MRMNLGDCPPDRDDDSYTEKDRDEKPFNDHEWDASIDDMEAEYWTPFHHLTYTKALMQRMRTEAPNLRAHFNINDFTMDDLIALAKEHNVEVKSLWKDDSYHFVALRFPNGIIYCNKQ